MRFLLILAALLLPLRPAFAQSVQAAVAPEVWKAIELCSVDNLFHFKSQCPSGWLTSPSLTGLAPIGDDLPLSALVPVPPSASAAPDIVGAFRFICNAGQILRDDPIVFPGQPGKSHLHQFYGNVLADAFSTYASLRAKGESTCMTTPFNRSGYWMPAMLDGKGNVVKPDYVAIYYKRRPPTDPTVSDPANAQYMGKGIPLPNGLRFIFGYDMLTQRAPTGGMWFNCVGTGARSGQYPNLAEAAKNCVIGGKVGAVIEAPNCWDGMNLDSPNHRDQMAYAQSVNGVKRCPTGYPYVIPGFTLGAWYTITSDPSKWSLASDAMFPTLPKGSTFHADFFMAWNPAVHAAWEQNCIDKMLNCAAGVLGNGLKIPGAQLRTDTSPKLVPVSSIP